MQRNRNTLLTLSTLSAVCLATFVAASQRVRAADGTDVSRLWLHSNLFVWCIVPFDAKKRGLEARAQMLDHLGIRRSAYDWREENIPTFDAEIEALQRYRIELLAWWLPLDANDPLARSTLELFKRHGVHPHLWVVRSSMGIRSSDQVTTDGWPKSPAEQEQRVKKEADRISEVVKLAEPYGCEVDLYKHNGWFGLEVNLLAIIAQLKKMSITNVGMINNFSHSRDKYHGDTMDFPPLCEEIKFHVVAVTITGTAMNGVLIYSGRGDRELEMMKTIEDSGWRGPVGLIGEKGGDAEVTLQNYLEGLNWLATEIRRQGAGGPAPFLPAY